MAFRIKRREDIGNAIRRMALEQLDGLKQQMRDEGSDVHETVHELRKTSKRMRSLLRLIQDHLGKLYHQENQFYRQLAGRFSISRDVQVQWQTFLETAKQVQLIDSSSDEGLGAVHEFLDQLRQAACSSERQLRVQFNQVLSDVELAQSRVVDWPIPNGGFPVIARGIARQYRRARRSMKIAFKRNSEESFHEWRKTTKYHGYHADVLRRIAPRIMLVHRDLVDELGERLGREHDLAVLRNTIRTGVDTEGTLTLSPAVRKLLEVLALRQQQERKAAWRLGYQVFAEKPDDLKKRWRLYWRAWRGKGP